MTSDPRNDAAEIRGRLLHEALLKEARVQTSAWLGGHPVTLPPHPPIIPPIQLHTTTDTGSMRVVQIA